MTLDDSTEMKLFQFDIVIISISTFVIVSIGW